MKLTEISLKKWQVKWSADIYFSVFTHRQFTRESHSIAGHGRYWWTALARGLFFAWRSARKLRSLPGEYSLKGACNMKRLHPILLYALSCAVVVLCVMGFAAVVGLTFGCGVPVQSTVPSQSPPGATGTSTQVLTLAGYEGEAPGVPDTGKERWAVKCGFDPLASKVNMTPKVATVEQLRTMPAAFTEKPKIGDKTRFAEEMQVYQVTATVVGFKLEGGAHGDRDIHVGIKGDTGVTMIAEIPDDSQSAKGVWGRQCSAARAAFIKMFGKPGVWKVVSKRVVITGPFFTDFVHGQQDVAPTGVELHPCLSIAEVKP